MPLPEEFLRDLKQRVSLAAYAGERLEWDRSKSKPAKGEYWACCPFHSERTASFKINDAMGGYYCFGCQAKGGLFDFVRHMENCTFPEAVSVLARREGLEVPAASPEEARRQDERERLFAANSIAVHFYRARLAGSGGAAARAYLREERRLSPETLARFRIGLAPDSRDGLWKQLQAGGVQLADAVAAGLVRDDRGSPRDFFRNRIMFPLLQHGSRCVGFGGRLVGSGTAPKYLNTAESAIFQKRRFLFNHGPAREAARKAGRLLVTEGYMDVIALHAHGFEEAVAPLGTALAEDHLVQLWRASDRILVALDGDEAGQRAANRVAETALAKLTPGKEILFATLPKGSDPDDFTRSHGAEAFAALLDDALSLSETVWRQAAEGIGRSPEGLSGLESSLRQITQRIDSPQIRRNFDHFFRDRIWQLKAGKPGAATPVRIATRQIAVSVARGGDRDYKARARVGGILLAMLRHPETLDELGETLASMPIGAGDLDSLRQATISAWMEGALDDARRNLLLRQVTDACRKMPHVAKTEPAAKAASALLELLRNLMEEHCREHELDVRQRYLIGQLASAEPDPDTESQLRQIAEDRQRFRQMPELDGDRAGA